MGTLCQPFLVFTSKEGRCVAFCRTLCCVDIIPSLHGQGRGYPIVSALVLANHRKYEGEKVMLSTEK